MKRKERINNKTVLPQLNKKSVIETLCETFGPCNINLKNKKILQRDIEALNAETYKMLKSIKIIKGLLKFLDFAKTDRELPSNKNVTRKTAFKYDIHKLHSILIGTYITEENVDKLTETQKCQLDYVKNNTQSFIKSATRFSLILNDIINILTTVNANVVGQNNMYAKVVNDTVAKSYSKLSAEKVENFTRISRDALGNETIKTGKIYVHDHGDPFNKIKKLILKYNLLQNIFMKKIYKLIGSFDEVDVKAINKVVGHTTTTALNVSHDSLTNRTEAIRTYSKNVIKNLRKLKDLARRLTSKNRKKRELEDDDSLEYLLTLMEYLLKQNHPLDTFPVNDGIDLLIDAIKQAPQIKSVVVKKVLDVTTTESSKIKFLTEVNSSESSSDIKFSKENIKFSKEDIKFSKEDNSSSQAEEFKLRYHKFNLNGQSIDDEEGEDSFLLNKRAKPHPSINVPEYYTIHKPTTPAIKALLEGSLSFTTDIPKKLTPSIVFATSGEIARQADFEKDEKKDNSFKFDVFDGDVEEELASSSTVSPDTIEMTEESNPESPIVDPKATSSPSSVEKEDPEVFRRIFRDSKTNLIGENIEPGDVSVSQSKSNLDWMEETYEEEEKGANRTAAENTTQNKIYAATEVAVHRRKLNRNDNISNISKDEEQKRTKQSAEDLIYRKEMNLLNSLDYGTTEKSEKQGSNSNESTEDKYTVDTFDVYFN
ncbi:uncharacterized protein LOC113227777 [Hyposmocoma kahamanoa]|uniref:uncharacterized protein LOC113227777 n=1 Tax=Hyposmocoma kahamanoa TaxID=1477025 RepID=UPI000E6D5C6E|nr:uncharacterized protein LOC113227777 [Hyposmocoma kahamanoa]